jgi:hypothetical protein
MTVSIEFKADISDVEKKAGEIPDIVDRNTRRSRATRKPWEGGGPGGGTKSDYDKLANAEQEIKKEQERRASEEAANQERQRKEADAEYRRKLKFNSRVLEDEQGAQAAAASESEKEKEKQAKEEAARKEKERKEAQAEYQRKLKFNSRTLQDQQAAEKKAVEAREKERKREAEKQANAKDWGDKFNSVVGAGLLKTLGPWAIAIKAFQLAIQAAGDGLERIRGTQTLGNLYGTNNQKMFNLQTAARKVGSNPDEISAIAGNLQQSLSGSVVGDPEGLRKVSLLKDMGMDIDQEKIASGAVDASDAIQFLANKYGDLTKNIEGARQVQQIFGDEYIKLIPLFREGSGGIENLGKGGFKKSQLETQAVKDTDRFWGDIWEGITGIFSTSYAGSKDAKSTDFHRQFQDYLNRNIDKPWNETIGGMFEPVDKGGLRQPGETKQELDKRVREMMANQKERSWMGEKYFNPLEEIYNRESKPIIGEANKVKGGTMPSLAIANSLQAMGGGDFASTLNRGPVDRIAEATEGTRKAAEKIDENTKPGSTGKTTPQPAVLVR